MPKALLALLVALVATGAVVAAVVVTRSPEKAAEPDPQPTYEPTPVAELETQDIAITRDTFCAAVPEEAVGDAIGGPAESSTAYGNGERARLGPGLRDVAHEFGCSWTTQDATARAWVFAPPVTTRSARELVRAVEADPRCSPAGDGSDFGRPSTTTVCELGERVEVSHRGLFGDAWLTCTLSAAPRTSRAELVDRADRWCGAVVGAARTAS